MVIGLGHSIAYAVLFQVGAVLGKYFLICIRVVGFHPLEKRGPYIEADAFKIPQFSIRAVAFGMDAFIPIFIRGCPDFQRNQAGDRVLTGRLVKVPVDAK
jgi:hypothetical protein